MTADLVGFGAMVVDRIHLVDRLIGPEQKTPIRSESTHVGGVVANHTCWAAALGSRTGLVGWIGDDPEGTWLLDSIAGYGVDVSRVLRCDDPTPVSLIFVEPGGGRAIYQKRGALARAGKADVRERWRMDLAGARIATSAIGQVNLDAVEAAFAAAREAGRETYLDFDIPRSRALGEAGLGDADTLDRILGLTTLLKLAGEACEEETGVADPAGAAAGMLDRHRAAGMDWVAVTDGERGAAIASADGVTTVPALPGIEAVDSTGAGDAFSGGLLVGRLRGLSAVEAARLGAACGAVCCESPGAVPAPGALDRLRAFYSGPIS